MSMSGHHSNRTPAVLRALALLGAVALLPLGVAGAQDASVGDSAAEELQQLIRSGELSVEDARVIFNAVTPVEWVGEHYLKTAAEIDAAVAAGKCSAEEGAAKKEAVAAELQAYAFYVEVMGATKAEARLRIGVESGKISSEKAAAMEGERATETHEWVGERLSAAGIPHEQMRAVLGGVERIIGAIKRKMDASEYAPPIRERFVAEGLSDEQIELAFGLAARAAKASSTEKKSGHDSIVWMLEPLSDSGIPRVVIRDVIGVIQKTMHGMREEGEAFDFRPFREHLVQLGLTDAQIELTQGLTARGFKADTHHEGVEGFYKRIGVDDETLGWLRKELFGAGITEQQWEPVMGGLLRIVLSMKGEGGQYVINPQMHEHLVGIGLSDRQIELLHKLGKGTLKNATRLHEAMRSSGEAESDGGAEFREKLREKLSHERSGGR